MSSVSGGGGAGHGLLQLFHGERPVAGRAHLQELHLKDEGGVGGDAPRSSLSVAELRGNDELALAALAHALHAFVPPSDDRADSKQELEGAAPVQAGVELGAVGQSAG